MSTYKLTYFDVRARGEVPRMLFHLAGVNFEDHRINFAEWKDLKPKSPSGGLPILQIDGSPVMYSQCNAICRYIARKYGFAGKTDLDQLRVDMIVDSINDMMQVLFNAVRDTMSDDEKNAERQKFVDETSHPMLEKLQAMLVANKGGDGWFVGDELTWADLQFQNWVDFTDYRFKKPMTLDKFPKLKALRKRVESHPKIAEHIANRKPDMMTK